MRYRWIRVSVIPPLVAALVTISAFSPAPAAGGSGNGNGGTSPPPRQGTSGVVIVAALVLVAVGVVWWLTRGGEKEEPKEGKSDAIMESPPKAMRERPAGETTTISVRPRPSTLKADYSEEIPQGE